MSSLESADVTAEILLEIKLEERSLRKEIIQFEHLLKSMLNVIWNIDEPFYLRPAFLVNSDLGDLIFRKFLDQCANYIQRKGHTLYGQSATTDDALNEVTPEMFYYFLFGNGYISLSILHSIGKECIMDCIASFRSAKLNKIFKIKDFFRNYND